MSGRNPSRAGYMIRAILFGVIVLMAAGCGGGGSLSSSGDSVNVSLASAPPNSAGLLSGGAGAADALKTSSPADNIVHAWITVTGVALIPGGDGAGADPEGETAVMDEGSTGPGLVFGSVFPPEEIDLLNLPAGQAARFLNTIDNVPAGTYGKIRLFYTDPKVRFEGATDNASVHPTANYHLDIHFVGGDLVVPVETGRAGGVTVHDVTVVFVLGKDGLKITVNPNKILMRPQVFATVGEVQYVVTGIADNVDKGSGSFDLATAGGRSFRVEYDVGTGWFFRDAARWVPVGGSMGVPALNDTALVDVLGMFSATGTLLADEILITFPLSITDNVVSGDPLSGWNPDNTFTLGLPADNVVVPMPDRLTALYDNAVSPHNVLDDGSIVQGAAVTARGYAVPGVGIEAYWISVWP